MTMWLFGIHVFNSHPVTAGDGADGNRHEARFVETIVIRQPTGETQRAVVGWTIRDIGNYCGAKAHAIGRRNERLGHFRAAR